MRRRDFIAFAVTAAGWPIAARGQKLPLIGFLGVGPTSGPHIRRGLAEQGFVEGRDYESVYKWAEYQPDRMAANALDVVQRRAALIIAATTAETLAAKAATQSIPIVFQSGGNPVAAGLVDSLNRPGGNLTGITNLNSDTTGKRLEILRELAPTATPIAFLVNPTSKRLADAETKGFQLAAQNLNAPFLVVNAGDARQIDEAFVTLVLERAGALVVSGDVVFFSNRDRLVALAARHEIPAVYAGREYPDAGGLVSFGTHFADGWHVMGVYAGRILKGERPADLPVQQVTKTELVINLKTAKALGLAIPATLLARADVVIE